MIIGGTTDHRSREGGTMIYPVYSRRSGGLSIGVNLFPDKKICSFDCPYCEVFPFETNIFFNLDTMKTSLQSAILEAKENDIPIKDICFSGNGEPTMSPDFIAALNAAEAVRVKNAPEAKLVVLTNGSGLLNNELFEFLKSAAGKEPRQTALEPDLTEDACEPTNLVIWLKLDAATEAWYQTINRSGIPLNTLLSCIRSFAAAPAPFIVQTMICTINGVLPPQEESAAWVNLVTELALLSTAANRPARRGEAELKEVHIYGKARAAENDPLAEAVPVEVLEERAALLRLTFRKTGINVPVLVF